jgi:hypothetical protein
MSFQEKLEAAQGNQTHGTLDEIRTIAGKGLSARLESLTEQLFAFTDDAIETNRTVYVAAHAAFRRLYPKEAMFGVEDLPLGNQGGGTGLPSASPT